MICKSLNKWMKTCECWHLAIHVQPLRYKIFQIIPTVFQIIPTVSRSYQPYSRSYKLFSRSYQLFPDHTNCFPDHTTVFQIIPIALQIIPTVFQIIPAVFQIIPTVSRSYQLFSRLYPWLYLSVIVCPLDCELRQLLYFAYVQRPCHDFSYVTALYNLSNYYVFNFIITRRSV